MSEGNPAHVLEFFDALRSVAARRGDALGPVLALGLNAQRRERLHGLLLAQGRGAEGIGALSASPVSRPAATPATWLDSELRQLLAEFGEREVLVLPDGFRQRVGHYIRRFTAPGDLREWFSKALVGQDKYRPLVRRVFAPYALPDSMHYLALIESAFNPYAVSKSKAVGIWQFIPGTAKHYGLTVDSWRDQRKDPLRSTKAAAEYLQDLMLDFGDGRSALLAMAAYNAGEGRVRRELRKLDHVGKRSFWTLVEKGLLAEETREYIPKVLAAAIVGKYRREFGFNASSHSEPVSTVMLYRPVPMQRILELTGMDAEALSSINPELSPSDASTPGHGVAFLLAVPARALKALHAEPALRAALQEPPEGQGSVIVYMPRRGNRWETISAWSGVPLSRLRADNAPAHAAAAPRRGKPLYLYGHQPGLMPHQHTVRRGQSLSLIARRYGTRVAWLRAWNGLQGDHLDIGDRLLMYVRQSALPSADGRQRADKHFVHTVRPGDSISHIARAFRTSVGVIKRTNRLGSSRIHPGQKIQVPIAGQVKKHVIRVRSGDTLSRIALRYGVSVQSIMIFNDLRQETIYVGDQLTLYLRS